MSLQLLACVARPSSGGCPERDASPLAGSHPELRGRATLGSLHERRPEEGEEAGKLGSCGGQCCRLGSGHRLPTLHTGMHTHTLGLIAHAGEHGRPEASFVCLTRLPTCCSASPASSQLLAPVSSPPSTSCTPCTPTGMSQKQQNGKGFYEFRRRGCWENRTPDLSHPKRELYH